MLHINWHYWGEVVVADRLEIVAAFWFMFSCVAVNWPHPDIPWDRNALKHFIYGVMQSISISRNPQLAAASYSQTKTDTTGTVTQTQASTETPIPPVVPPPAPATLSIK